MHGLKMYGLTLYDVFLPHFIIVSIILLVAMIGAIVLCLEENVRAKRQNTHEQNIRSNAVILIKQHREA